MSRFDDLKKAANMVKGLGADASFEGIVVKNGAISHGKETVPLAGARVSVETAGDVDRRITATRLILTGPFALAFRKKKDHRELYLTVESNGSMFVVPVDPKKGADARAFAAKATSLGASGAAPQTVAPPPVTDMAGQLAQLQQMHESGALSDDEYTAAKAKLLG